MPIPLIPDFVQLEFFRQKSYFRQPSRYVDQGMKLCSIALDADIMHGKEWAGKIVKILKWE